MGSIFGERNSVNVKAVFEEAIKEARKTAVRQLEQEVEKKLSESIDEMLEREPYERRKKLGDWVEIAGQCQRCKSRQSYRFSRNGGRKRTLESQWGVIEIWQQRLVCECGGSVRLEMKEWLRPYQRIGEDVRGQIERWGELRLSLREMHEELATLNLSPLSLRTLNQRLHQLSRSGEWQGGETPPVLQVDAIWVSQLVPNGSYRYDSKRRRRACKSRIKRPILIAMGVWPETDRAEILAWHLAKSEDEAEWLAFLSQLEALGLCGDSGLQLLIHDGGSGLCAALRTIHFGVSDQRCLFHKLRNIYNAIHIQAEGLSRKEQRQRRNAIFRDFYHIWQPVRKQTVLRRYLSVVRLYRTSQPDAVRCLRTDFRNTIAYFDLLLRFPHWQTKHLRTTSRLERFNRAIRRRVRAALAFHSDAGLSAMLAQVVDAFNPPKS